MNQEMHECHWQFHLPVTWKGNENWFQLKLKKVENVTDHKESLLHLSRTVAIGNRKSTLKSPSCNSGQKDYRLLLAFQKWACRDFNRPLIKHSHKQFDKTIQTNYSKKAQEQTGGESFLEELNASAIRKRSKKPELVSCAIQITSQKTFHGVQNQTVLSNTKSFSAPLSPESEFIEDTKACDAFKKFENSHTLKHKWSRKPSMDTRFKKAIYKTDHVVMSKKNILKKSTGNLRYWIWSRKREPE